MKKTVINRLISVMTILTFILSVYWCFPESIAKINSLSASETAAASNGTVAEGIENPFNKQDDMEVPYDSKSWIQPKEWNMPRIKPSDYKGGIMLYFDKIGLEPENARGNVQRIYFSITGATEPVSHIKFHIFYDTRLTVKENSNGDVITTGKGLKEFTTGSSMIEEGQLVFYAYSKDTMLNASCLFTIDFIIPENAEPGEVYPIGIAYVDDDIAYDTFINSENDDAGKLQMTYVFTKGIYNGYIKMLGEKKTTATTTTTITTTTCVSTAEYDLGDVNNDGLINAVDASSVLAYYAHISTGSDGGYSDSQKKSADVDYNRIIDAVDAAKILSYYAYISTAIGDVLPIQDYLEGTL